MAMRISRLFGFVLCVGVTACASPPPSVYVSHGQADGEGLDIGQNAVGESCTLVRRVGDALIFCGVYEQPSGRVVLAGQSSDPNTAIGTGPWRVALDQKALCKDPEPASLPGLHGLVMQCTQRKTSYASVALALQSDHASATGVYLVDAVKPVEGVIGRAVGVMAGDLPAVPAKPKAEAASVTAKRAASQDLELTVVAALEAVDRHLALGGSFNQVGNYASAELAYRTAASLMEKQVGPNSPALAVPLAREAVQLSNEGLYPDADLVFARAVHLAESKDQLDPLALPTIYHLRALDQLNRGNAADALPLLDEAVSGFAQLLPPEIMSARSTDDGTGPKVGVEAMVANAQTQLRNAVPTQRDAFNGLLEARRYRANALRALGRNDEAAAELASMQSIYLRADPELSGRGLRSTAMADAAVGKADEAQSVLRTAIAKFSIAQPGSMTVAETMLLRTSLAKEPPSLEACNAATQILLDLRKGIRVELLAPCLETFAKDAEQHPDTRANTLSRMFAVLQLVQGNVTATQVAQATAMMSENARNPKAAAAVRGAQSAEAELQRVLRVHDERVASGAPPEEVAKLDQQIAAARDTLRDAELTKQVDAPGFQQLVGESISAEDVLSNLRPGETLVTTVLAPKQGWAVALHEGKLSLGRIDGGAERIDALVGRFRKGMETTKSDGSSEPFDTDAAYQLYQSIFGGFGTELAQTKTLIVAPGGSLLSVPFAALLTAPASPDDLVKAPYLIRKMAVLHVPSPASFRQLRRAEGTSRATRPWTGFGDPVLPTTAQIAATFPSATCHRDSDDKLAFAAIPGSLKELDAARRLYKASPQDEEIGARFNAKDFTSEGANLADYRVLHFATHALLQGEIGCLAEPALLMSAAPGSRDAKTALFTASMVADLKLDADLVILSACNTGGSNGNGESLSGLARSFITAGARGLIVSHWEADDQATTYLLANFVARRNAEPKEGPANSLAWAQRRLLQDAAQDLAYLAHPRLWAVMALVGGTG